MEHATTLDHTEDVYEPSLTPDSLGKLGMWIFLVGDTMSFGALLAAYAALRAGAGIVNYHCQCLSVCACLPSIRGVLNGVWRGRRLGPTGRNPRY